MEIYLARHGQTDLNRDGRWQGRTDQPLNEKGRADAGRMGHMIEGVSFDRVYVSPLDRAMETAEILTGRDRGTFRVDDRLIEADFGPYDRTRYGALSGLPMAIYWALPELIPAPEGVESVSSLVERSRSFLRDLFKEAGEENMDRVLITCHGGIMRALTGCLLQKRRGVVWRPKPRNCEIRVFSPIAQAGETVHIFTIKKDYRLSEEKGR